MNSRITIDLDAVNNPVIKIEYKHSDDVRDKMVKKFLEGFGGNSSWARFVYVNSAETASTAIIEPITWEQLPREAQHMAEAVPTL